MITLVFEMEDIQKKLDDFLTPFGFEAHPFKVCHAFLTNKHDKL